MPIVLTSKGSFKKTYGFLKFIREWRIERALSKYAEEGLKALMDATPIDSGKTRDSWGYSIESDGKSATIHWNNSNINDGVNVAVLIQYGHGTGTGGYVQGIDYINPAIKPVFDKIAKELWKEVTSA